ncbi:MAG: hypothetical protein IKK28_11130, partial [Mogibacterium sp.]|nr:hypothetical protein [Mogibacterium sp.]
MLNEYLLQKLLSGIRYLASDSYSLPSIIQTCNSNIAVFHQDATAFREEWQGKMDTVIADVPCSGYGIIRKKPD